MKSAALVSFALLISSIALPAQNYDGSSAGVARIEGLSPAQPATVLSQPIVVVKPTYCPVSIRAQHGPSGAMLQANKSSSKGPGQLLHLSLINPGSRQIASARFEVRGSSGKARTSQALSYPGNGDADLIRTFEATFSPAPGNTASGDLWAPGMTAVRTINLVSVTFADGSTQSFPPRDACRVAPDLKMLVAGH